MFSVVVLISGSGSNLRALLEAATSSDYPARIVAVGADRECAGLTHAEDFGIPTFVVAPAAFTSRDEWGSALVSAIEPWQPDLVVCAGFMRIVPALAVSALFPRLINMHPALLPLYPGAHAVRDALADGANVTGATIHVVDEGVDTGPVIRAREVAVHQDDSESSLHERIKVEERQLIVETVADIARERIDLEEISRR
ncbi:MAG: phosphoribosylglycinamide formyltransferase [Aurantimicrobium sp.]|nr:phosphoribosylglycinamide formyltransferase [Aurantimicrobium sp.]